MRSIILAAALVLAELALADETGFDGRIRIGGTGVMCVREPCPRIGVMAVAGARDGPRLTRPLFAGGTPPRLSGAEADQSAVRDAWGLDRCLVVESRFTPPDRLDVRRVLGACGAKD